MIEWPAYHSLFDEPIANVCKDIGKGDTMFVPKGEEHYFSVGQSAFRCIKLALLAAEKRSVRNILDIPCGHGRVQRVLRAVFPGVPITACDLDRDGVNYCAGAFGATPVYSEENPKDIPIREQYDLIWCGSLLTHLDRHAWQGFLRFFEARLAPGGVCVFTVHGRRSVDWLRNGTHTYDLARVPDLLNEYDRDGFGYQRYPAHTLPNYGVSIASPSWVMNQLLTHTTLRLVTYIEHGWDNHQDVIGCVRHGTPPSPTW